ncbi:MAG: DUF6164 family protein [Wenzhouxiangella sp.]|jgi:hypothetical protein|nr:DUF6164 family protein [Wenzhouxiangella sp.]
MARQLLNLRHVSDEEAHEVAELMDEHGIEHYSTPPGSFGISAGGIWLKDPDDYPRARALMDEYQAARSLRVRAELEQARQEGRAETFWSVLRRHPVRTGLYLAAAGFILMIFFAPVIQLGRSG